MENETAVFKCKVEGHTDVEWYYDDIKLKESGNISFIEEDDGTLGLQLKNVTEDDEGRYGITVSNLTGMVSSQVDLKVSGKDHQSFLSWSTSNARCSPIFIA